MRPPRSPVGRVGRVVDQRRGEPLPVDKIAANHVIPVVLAALMEDVVHSHVLHHRADVIDYLQTPPVPSGAAAEDERAGPNLAAPRARPNWHQPSGVWRRPTSTLILVRSEVSLLEALS